MKPLRKLHPTPHEHIQMWRRVRTATAAFDLLFKVGAFIFEIHLLFVGDGGNRSL